jgi:ATP-binding cassette subfamily B protein
MTADSQVLRLTAAPKLMLGGAVLFGILNTLLIPIPCLAAWRILEGLIDPSEPVQAGSLVLWAGLAILVRWFCQAVSIALSHFAALYVSKELRHSLLAHLGELPLHWHAGQSVGGLKKVFTNDIGQVDSFLAHHIPDTISALLLPLTALCCLTWVNWQLGLLLIALFVLCLAVQGSSYAIMGKSDMWSRYNQSLENLNAAAVEFVRGMPVVKLFNRDMQSSTRMRAAVEGFKDIQILGHRVFAPRWALFSSLTVMPFTLAAVVGTVLHAFGFVSLVDLALFLMLSGITLAPLAKLVRLAAIFSEAGQSMARIRGILAEPAEIRGTLTAPVVKHPRVVVENLGVRFGDKIILHHVNFVAEPGTTTAVVGPSGAGKSTLAAVLAGMESTSEGSITIDGYGLIEFPLHELARLVTPVFQTPYIFTGTVAENIALSSPDASQEAIAEAASLARCADFIHSLPQGYVTRIGDGGEIHLSGGQNQRIALARMALRRAPVIVLDEATAYADAESEAEIQSALSDLMYGRTVIVIAHRLNASVHM